MPETLDPYWFPCDGPWLGIPHAWNVLTNVPFLLVGLAGLRALLATPTPTPTRSPTRRPWLAVWTWIALLAFGSGLYHWFLTPFALGLDRVCIAGISAALCWQALAGVGRAAPRTGWLLLAAFQAPVIAWFVFDLTSLVYGLSQAVAAVVVFACHVCRARSESVHPPTHPRTHPPGWPLVVLLLCYAAAKLLELGDEAICTATGAFGGHPIKHVVAAVGLAFLLRYMEADLHHPSAAPLR